MGVNIDIHRVAVAIVALIFLVIGNYLPKFDKINHFNADAELARKINRLIGYETVVMGILGAIAVFLPAEFSIWFLILLIPYGIVALITALVVAKRFAK